MSQQLQVAIVGGGWAGLAAAVEATRNGCQVTLYEASRHWGGRARRLAAKAENPCGLDNGQHILIGAYTATLKLMADVGVPVQQVLRTMPLALPFPDGSGMACPPWARRWPAPLDTLAAIGTAQGWSWSDRGAFLKAAARWRLQGFKCAEHLTVLALCETLPPRVMSDLIEPLCVAALNTQAPQASAKVFLRVLQDALLGPGHAPWRSADLLLPQRDLGELFPDAATDWLTSHGAQLKLGTRVTALHPQIDGGWAVETSLPPGAPSTASAFDHVILACPPRHAAALLSTAWGGHEAPSNQKAWCDAALAMRYEAIGTVYAETNAPAWRQPQPMLALRDGPAQFVFDRGQLGGPMGLLAFVASAWQGPVQALETKVQQQAAQQLGLTSLRIVHTVVEKQATFACTPGLKRPWLNPATHLWAAGDAIAGPYPATLEGAVRSGLNAVQALLRGDSRNDRCASR